LSPLCQRRLNPFSFKWFVPSMSTTA
jgi:hypothetical protein